MEVRQMFEVGKKYSRIDTRGLIVNCVYVDPFLDYALLTMPENERPFIRYAGDFECYKEHVEPVKHVRYFAITKGGIIGPYTSYEGARLAGGVTNLGVKRVEFVEGTWDE